MALPRRVLSPAAPRLRLVQYNSRSKPAAVPSVSGGGGDCAVGGIRARGGVSAMCAEGGIMVEISLIMVTERGQSVGYYGEEKKRHTEAAASSGLHLQAARIISLPSRARSRPSLRACTQASKATRLAAAPGLDKITSVVKHGPSVGAASIGGRSSL
ncbi:hypothetical protein ACQ4PT_018032 [Festuca glaucescens]